MQRLASTLITMMVLASCTINIGQLPPADDTPEQPAPLAAPPEVAPEEASASTGAEASTDSPVSTEESIQHIRDRYSQAMALREEAIEFSCLDDPLAGTMVIRKERSKLVWASYSVGYEHGAETQEILLEQGNVIFILKDVSIWSFDMQMSPDADGSGGTVDTTEQERYYYRDGQMIRALYKSASARSALNESLEDKLASASNSAHPKPDGPGALQAAKAVIAAYQGGQITESWCGL